MQPTFTKVARSLAQAFIVTLALSQAAHAEPATRESLQRYFDAAKSERIADTAAKAMLRNEGGALQAENDPKAKAKLATRYERLYGSVRKHVVSTVFGPKAIADYQQYLQESEVKDMIVMAQSPFGRNFLDKVNPVLQMQPAVVDGYVSKRIEQMKARTDDSVPPPVALPKPAAGSKEALALAMMLEWPGAREQFTKGMAQVAEKSLEQAASFESQGNTDLAKRVRRFATAVRTEFKFEEVAAVQARMIAEEMNEADIATLTAENKNPARFAQRHKIEQIEAELMGRAGASLKSEEMQKLLAGEQAAARPAKAGKATSKQ
ncbi:hypothetical protein [Massilia pseudoviolaceinigra]|uniref:hypothetical protein n=1 Tax=Massilia pseudoviolaceinigra TaxID=3057165 RepID=UPI002796674D|nr:hypothetical protein [Massilia sp. CCM 9206]MDQ1920204.1 hypothetical protein [Massilia sp. CCM 9206]